MTIKGVIISDKSGVLLFYRNYSCLNHVDFEDLAYQLGHAEETSDRQHTYIHHMSNRLVFLPLEAYFLSLITDLNSNIIQDQKTLSQARDVTRMCLDSCSEISEESIQDEFLELAFGLDDLINMGTANNVSCLQVQESLKMESSNEQVHLQLLEDKVKERQREVEEESREIERNHRIRDIVENEKKQIEINRNK